MKKTIVALICLLAVVPCEARIITVDDDGPADFNNIQSAVNDADENDVVVVRPGIYTGDGNRDIDFLGKAITVRSTDPNDPNIVAATIIDCNGSESELHRGFYWHRGEGHASVVSGLTITGGYQLYRGGGIYCEESSPTIDKCVIRDCGVDGHGGGINCQRSSPEIRDCEISGNYAAGSGGGLSFYRSSAALINCRISGNWVVFINGGGVDCDESALTISDCLIIGNSSLGQSGGGMSISQGSSPTVSNCVISGNSAEQAGGIYCNASSPTIWRCEITHNSALYSGGAYLESGSTARLIDCLIIGNSANRTGGIKCTNASPMIANCTLVGNLAEERGGAFGFSTAGSPQITNCILWNNSPEEIWLAAWDPPSQPVITHSDVRGGWPGVGNIHTDPRFVDESGGDYHLLRNSPCIDAGDNNSIPADINDMDGDGDTNEPIPWDLDGMPRIIEGLHDGNAVVDMGAYETMTQTRICYVDADANGANDGTSWQDAFKYFQDALQSTMYGDLTIVAGGVYRPDCNSAEPNGTGDRKKSFHLVRGAVTEGGYAGVGAPDPNERDFELYASVLSGDLAGDDGPGFANNAENCYHVVCANSTDLTTVLEGFTITGGNANGDRAEGSAGGMYAEDGRPTIMNCIFTGNCGRMGGTLLYSDGGGVLRNCVITGNVGERYGAIYNSHSSPKITNCTICGNRATIVGGIYNRSGSNPALADSIFWCNYDNSGLSEVAQIAGETGSVDYCCIQGLTGTLGGLGNIDCDPCFVEPGRWVDADDPNIVVEANDPNAVWVDGDYHLKSEGWYWNTDANQWDWEEVTSRCVDAGNPGSPLGDEALTLDVDPLNRFGQNLRINMGAYGGTAEASMPPYHWALLADLNNDGTVNFIDMGHYVRYWLDAGSELPGDLDRRGTVDLTDYALLGQDYLLQTSWHQ